MFVSVWHAKKMGSRFLDNVRKAKRRRLHAMVGVFLKHHSGLLLLLLLLFYTMTVPHIWEKLIVKAYF